MNWRSNGMTKVSGKLTRYSHGMVKAKPVRWEKMKSAGPGAKWAKKTGPGAKWAKKPGVGKMKAADVWWV